MNELHIQFVGKLDKNKKEYYMAVCRVPADIDLSSAVFLFFPFEEDNGKFGGEMIVKHFEKRGGK